jgi:acyl-CoA reductase-like NAD-dependent aldehyde dehydrogenase
MATTATDHPLLIAGERVETGEWTEVRSPYSGELVGRVARGGADEAQRAVSTYTFAAVEARKLAGEVVPMEASPSGAGKLGLTLRLPIGIVGAISPFNFPLNLVAHKIAPALAAGCPVVLKPASATPLSALFLAGLEEEAGLPPGWLNVVAGAAAQIGDALVEDDRVKLITFTGSGAVGWGIAERAYKKRVKLELGNATPAIVCADAPPDTAAKLAANAFSFAGQSCISVQRIFVLADAWDEFVPQFVPKVEALVVGDPADEETDVGPVISDDDRDRILEWIRESEGEVLAGGDTTEGGLIRPTVIARPAPRDRVQCEEVFGPVVTLTKVATLDEAIEQANATRYGLQAAIFSRDVQTCLAAAQRLEFGGVTVNEAPTFRADQMPYGGVKASGNTKEGPAWTVREMTEERLVVLQL